MHFEKLSFIVQNFFINSKVLNIDIINSGLINKTYLVEHLYNDIKSGKFIIAGPCVLEDYDKSLMMAKFASEVCERYGFTYIFKASFDKANRTSVDSYRGVGIEKGREILKEINDKINIFGLYTTIQSIANLDSLGLVFYPNENKRDYSRTN